MVYPNNEDPSLSEAKGIRYLHLGSEWIQGAMRIRQPNELVLDYTRQMMAWLLFHEPEPHDQLAILGLGAGALLRYLIAHTPATIQTIECNPKVTALCQAYFRLPQSPRSTITHEDAAQWVKRTDNQQQFSALLVDLYDGQAQGPVCDSLEFYEGCRGVLKPDGVMAVNLFGRHRSFSRNIRRISQAFDKRLLALPNTPAGNRIVLAFGDQALHFTAAQLLARAQSVAAQYRLPAVQWARALLDTSQSRPHADVRNDVNSL